VLFATDFSQDRVGNFPSGLKYVRGPLEVVLVDGVSMLRSIGPAEFIIPLAQPLPQDFTLEFDFVARNSNCCSGEELAFEGSPALNRSTGSAWVSWHHQYAAILGGGQALGNSTVRFSEDLQGELKGQLGQIQMMMSGTQFKLFTNGRQLYNIPNLVFRRSNVLRVYLGGLDDGTAAVYLARVRLATGAPAPGVVAVVPQVSPPPRPAAPTAVMPRPAPRPPTQTAPAAPPVPLPPPPTPATSPASGIATAPSRAGPAVGAGPVVTAASAAANAARCVPGSATAARPQKFMAIGMRVGGAPLQWVSEPNTEYLVERAPAPPVPPPSITWTRLASTCDVGGSLVPGYYNDEDGTSYPTLSLADVYPGLQMGGAYQYRLTRIQADGTSGSGMVYWEAPSGSFRASPTSTVSGSTVTITTGVSYCQPFGIRCDPWMLEFSVASSSTGFGYTKQQAWYDNSDPSLPGSEEGTFAFAITGVPAGTHVFTVTALYPPDLKVSAGSVTVIVP
jgi:hypothetical protein